LYLTPSLRWNSREYPRTLILLAARTIGLHFAADSMDLSLLKFLWLTPFGTNRKCICDFLLVRHSNLGPILHRFGDIAGFTVLLIPPLFHPNFVPLDQVAHVVVNVSRYLKLFGREIIFEVFQHERKSYLNVTGRQTDRQTDGRTPRSA